MLQLLSSQSYEERPLRHGPCDPLHSSFAAFWQRLLWWTPDPTGIQLQRDRFNVLVYGYAKGETPSPIFQSPGTGYQRVLKVKAR